MEQPTDLLNGEQGEKDLREQIQELVSEKEKIKEEFNIQRAKLKELYLQKEGELQRTNQENIMLNEQMLKLRHELDDCKSQIVVDSMTLESNFEAEKRKAEEEIATLQTIVHETVEESSSTRTLYDSELSKLEAYIQHLQKENTELRKEKERSQNQSPHHSSQEHSSLAPSQVLNVLTKGLKKLGADSFSSQDSDDGIKKPQEDAELLRSLVEPLEDQIKALKEKLRATDDELQRYKDPGLHIDEKQKNISLNATTSTNTSFDFQRLTACDMCSNYEAELVKEQHRNREVELKVQNAEKAAERHKEELLKEIGFRKDMEEKWNEKKEEHKQQVAELTRATECTEQDLKELRQYFNQMCGELKMSLGKLTHEREMVQQELVKLQKENDNLVGKYAVHSQMLQSEIIDLPNTVEELHELVLKTHQDLIIAKLGKEAAEETVNNLQLDIKYLKDRITHEQHERKAIEEHLDAEIKVLKKQIDVLEKEKKRFIINQEKLLDNDKQNRELISEQKEQIEKMGRTIGLFEKQNSELKIKISALQHELDNTEAVQKDFVRLSQSLQVQLEKIRESDSVVRWQHEEDVEECPLCRTNFTSLKQKHHCRHCGQIFCLSCLNRTVPSGPNSRPSKVCDVCHTLLVKSSAPYFSEVAPITN